MIQFVPKNSKQDKTIKYKGNPLEWPIGIYSLKYGASIVVMPVMEQGYGMAQMKVWMYINTGTGSFIMPDAQQIADGIGSWNTYYRRPGTKLAFTA